MLNVWLWKRDGFKFDNMPSSTNNSGSGVNTNFSPMLAQIRGYRIFLGNCRQSFPDPTLVYSATQGAAQRWIPRASTSTCPDISATIPG